MSSFSEMRNLLLLLYNSKSICDEQFLTLYESYSSKNPEFPYNSYPKFDYDQMNELECLAEFRVRKQDIKLLANVLQLPVTFRRPQRTTCDRNEGLCMLLKRFSYPCRYSDMIHRFARPVPEINMGYWPSVRSRWLDIGQVLFLRVYGPRRSQGP